MARLRAGENRGFSLIELTVSMALLLTLMSSVFFVLAKYQRAYQNEQSGADVLQGARGTMELLDQEIGQAGSFSFPAGRQLSVAVTGNTTAQWVTLSSMANVFVGEKLLVDTGANEDLVPITNTDDTRVFGVFAKTHAINTPVKALGTFAHGLLESSLANPNQLRIFGDINNDGVLVYVEYTCSTAAGTLTRSSTPIGAAQSTPQTLMSGLQPNPSGVPCFTYSPLTTMTTTPAEQVLTQVSITLTSRATTPDPQTGIYRSVTTSQVVTPRNTGLAVFLAANNMANRIQPTPTLPTGW